MAHQHANFALTEDLLDTVEAIIAMYDNEMADDAIDPDEEYDDLVNLARTQAADLRSILDD